MVSDEQCAVLRDRLCVSSLLDASVLFNAACLSDATYEPPDGIIPFILERARSDDFVRVERLQRCLEHAQHRYLIAETAYAVFVAFRGSKSLDDFLSDVVVSLMPFSVVGGVSTSRSISAGSAATSPAAAAGLAAAAATAAAAAAATAAAAASAAAASAASSQPVDEHARADAVPASPPPAATVAASAAAAAAAAAASAASTASHVAHVHEGFMRRTNGVRVGRLVELARSRNKMLVLCGHSLGGSVAALVTLRLLAHMAHNPQGFPIERVRCVTFGASPYGDAALRALVERSNWTSCFWHFVTDGDIIPRSILKMPSAMERLVRPAEATVSTTDGPLYRPAGRMFRIVPGARVLEMSSDEFVQWAVGQSISLRDIQEAFRAQHRMGFYAGSLSRLRQEVLRAECFANVSLASLGLKPTLPAVAEESLLPNVKITEGSGSMAGRTKLRFRVRGEHLDLCNGATLDYEGQSIVTTELQCTEQTCDVEFEVGDIFERRATAAILHISSDFGTASLQLTIHCMHALLLGGTGAGKTSLFRELIMEQGDTPGFEISHVAPDRSRVRHYVKGFLRFTDRRGVERYTPEEMRELEEEVLSSATHPDIVLFVHNIATRVFTDDRGVPLLLPLLRRIQQARIPIVYALTNKYAVDSDERPQIVAEVMQLLEIPASRCFVVNSRKKDSHGVEGINEMLAAVYDALEPDLRAVFLAHLSARRRLEFLKFLRPGRLLSNPAFVAAMSTGASAVLVGVALTVLTQMRSR